MKLRLVAVGRVALMVSETRIALLIVGWWAVPGVMGQPSPAEPALPPVVVTATAGTYRLRLGDGALVHETRAEPRHVRTISVPESPVVLVLWEEADTNGAVHAHYAISLDGTRVARVVAPSYELGLAHGAFDPLHGVPEVEPALAASVESELYLVQFVTQPLEAYRLALERRGARLFAYVPEYAYVVQMSPATRAGVEVLPYVRWVGAYHPAYRLDGDVRAALTNATLAPGQAYNLLLIQAGPAAKAAVVARIAGSGGGIVNPDAGARLVQAVLAPDQLVAAAHWDEVQFIDRWSPPEVDLGIAGEISGSAFLLDTLGFAGSGVRAEVMDNGIRLSHADFNPAPLIHGGMPDIASHGTSTYGINFGDGIHCSAGVLPDAIGIFSDYNLLTNRYNHTAELVNPALIWRAVYQSNSWGSGLTTTYTTISADMDELLFDHDLLIFQSQSNQGNQNSRPQAWAKNVVSIGGIHSEGTLRTDDDDWCTDTFDPCLGGAPGSPCASRGPASDGRIKPDLSHFYDCIEATDSGSNTDCTLSFGGTSGATPITAGHAGLFFELWQAGMFGNVPGADVFDSRPRMALSKAVLIATADQWTFSGANHDLTRTHQGWGRVNVKNIYDYHEKLFWVDETDILAPLTSKTYELAVATGEPALRATMTYADPAGNPAVQVQHRVNDLDLKLVSPSGVTYWGNVNLSAAMWSAPGGVPDNKNTVECVFVPSPEAGVWTVEISAVEVNQDGHGETAALDVDFAVVITGAVGESDLVAPSIVAADPPTDNPYVYDTQPFRDVLQPGATAELTQGIGAPGTPAEGSVAYSSISVTFSGPPITPQTIGNTIITCTGDGPLGCPYVTSITPPAGGGAGPYILTLISPIPPGHCTTLTFAGTQAGEKLQYQSLPGDVDHSGSSTALDVQALVVALADGSAAAPANLPRYDINRSGGVSSSDVLRLVGLMNGVNTTQAWLAETVAACP